MADARAGRRHRAVTKLGGCRSSYKIIAAAAPNGRFNLDHPDRYGCSQNRPEMLLTTPCEGSRAQSQRTNGPVAPHICPNSLALRAPSKGELKGPIGSNHDLADSYRGDHRSRRPCCTSQRGDRDQQRQAIATAPSEQKYLAMGHLDGWPRLVGGVMWWPQVIPAG